MQKGRISDAGANFSLLSGRGGAADMTTRFDTRHIADAPGAIAPDGSEVRLLGALVADFRIDFGGTAAGHYIA